MINKIQTNNNKITNYISSGNTIVDQLGQMDITGDITPKNLYYTVLGKDGNPNRLAIDILSHLIFCYRPSTEYNKTTDTYTFKKRFNHSLYVQKKYRELKDLFNASEHQVRDALDCLVNLNVVIKHTYNEVHNGVKCNNVLYLEVVPAVLSELLTRKADTRTEKEYRKKYNIPEEESITIPQANTNDVPKFITNDSNVVTILEPANDINDTTLVTDSILPSREEDTKVVTELTPPSRDDVTTNTYNNTKINTEINTNTTTEKASVVYPESALSWCRDPYPEFTDEELSMLLDAANGDIMKVINSRKEYDKQKSNIMHPIPWIVSCIKKGYNSFTPIETPKKKEQNFKGRNYDFDKLQDWFDGKLDVKDTSELLKTGTD